MNAYRLDPPDPEPETLVVSCGCGVRTNDSERGFCPVCGDPVDLVPESEMDAEPCEDDPNEPHVSCPLDLHRLAGAIAGAVAEAVK